MKIFYFFMLHVFSGPVSCFDVIGYPRGSVMIFCNHRQSGKFNTYFCKVKPKECIYAQMQKTSAFHQKVSLFDSPGVLTVIYRNLRLQDAGLYQCGEPGRWNHNMNVKVNEDPCCLSPNTVAGYLGENVTISCSYPEEFKRNTKLFYKLQDQQFTAVINAAASQSDRFSMSDDGASTELIVKISDVREDDGGVYYCGVWNGGAFISYSSFFTEIQLQVTEQEKSTVSKETAPSSASYRTTTAPPAVTSDEEHLSSPLLISISVCVVLLLVGGSSLTFCILICKKRPDFTPSFRTELSDTTQDSGVHVNASSPSNRSDKQIHSTVQPPKDQDPTYATVSFLRNPASPADTSAVFSQEESATEYATIRHHADLE
ncbi:hypothetical protein MHYP_G00104780 [Metynnis hypsauchen]